MLFDSAGTLLDYRFIVQNDNTSHDLVLNLHEVKDLSLHTNEVADQGEASAGFCSMKRLLLFLVPSPSRWVNDASPSRVSTPALNSQVPIFTWVERGTESKLSCPRTQWGLQFGIEGINHEGTTHPQIFAKYRSTENKPLNLWRNPSIERKPPISLEQLQFCFLRLWNPPLLLVSAQF